MKMIKPQYKNMISALMVCLSLFVMIKPALSTDMTLSTVAQSAMSETSEKMMSRHCDKMKNMGIAHECCDKGTCDCSCMTLSSVFLSAEVQTQQPVLEQDTLVSSVGILRPQYSHTPTPPPII